MVDSSSETERRGLIGDVMSLEGWLYWQVRAGYFDQWLSIEVTMPQLKTLILVYGSEQQCLRMGQLASSLGVALSTATGIVDRLVEQGLLVRQEDPEDRRLVVVRLTEKGRETIELPHRVSQQNMLSLLEKLSLPELRILAQALGALHDVAPDLIPSHRISV
ncbi:MAG: MarR family transcriptional regulator [Chloroflexi bacterium]|nr:MarR family transcriptional regulator [Chloroflexota bacterium]MCL5110520.1 MarR family transcriptional regulator [Chloroflexota bacterium]